MADTIIPFRITSQRENPLSQRAREETEQRTGKTFASVEALIADLTGADENR